MTATALAPVRTAASRACGTTAPACTPPSRPAVLLAEGRRAGFTYHALARDDIDVVLLRLASVPLTGQDAEATAHVPTFTLDTAAPLDEEAARYLRWMKGTKNLPRPHFFCNLDDALQPHAQRFAALVDLPHLTHKQLGPLRDRTTLKDRYAQLALPHAAYRPLRTLDEVRAFGDEHGWPVLVTCVERGSHAGTRRIDSPTALAGAAPLDPARRWMAQEYVEGRALRLCAVVAHGVVLDAYLEVRDAGLRSAITYAPSEDIPLDARELAQGLVDGLRIPFGPLHCELVLTDDGRPVLGDLGVAAAPPGDHDLPMNHATAFGFDLPRVVLDTCLDRVPLPAYTRDRAVGDLLLPAAPGRVVHISSEEELLRLPGVFGVRLTARPGDVPDVRAGAHTGQVRVEGATAHEVARRMREVLAHFELKTDDGT